MTDASAWQRAVDPTRRIGHALELHASIGSTNDRARQALLEPGGEGRAVVAELQTAGRGRRGRAWLSPPGVNLIVSVALRPRLESAAAGRLGLAAALAVRDACAAMAPAVRVGVRWPNDVVASADGAKVAGLLVETVLEDGRLAEAVIGIGINANWRRAEMPAEIAGRATSLADLSGAAIDRAALLAALLDGLDREVGLLERGISPVDRFRAVSTLAGRHVSVDLGGEVVDGTAAGIGDDGALLLETSAGRLALTVGEVVAVRDALRGAPA